MANYSLTAKSPLDGYSMDHKGIAISEISGFMTLSLGAFKDCEKALKATLKKKLGLTLPQPGDAMVEGDLSILSVARDQWFIRFPEKDGDIVTDMANDLKDLAAITDQSDSWVEIEMSGSKVREKLERLCPIDLHPDAFPVNAVARTSMEHLGVIIMRLKDSADDHACFLLLSPRSSAKSFLHALK